MKQYRVEIIPQGAESRVLGFLADDSYTCDKDDRATTLGFRLPEGVALTLVISHGASYALEIRPAPGAQMR